MNQAKGKIGEYIENLSDVQFSCTSELAQADISCYRTCRGVASVDLISKIFDGVLNEDCNEDEKDWAVYEGLWDLLMHQYTMYSATPIALYMLLSKYPFEIWSSNSEVNRFVRLCSAQGTKNIFLLNEEIEKNHLGQLPLYPVEEIVSGWCDSNDIPIAH